MERESIGQNKTRTTVRPIAESENYDSVAPFEHATNQTKRLYDSSATIPFFFLLRYPPEKILIIIVLLYFCSDWEITVKQTKMPTDFINFNKNIKKITQKIYLFDHLFSNRYLQ